LINGFVIEPVNEFKDDPEHLATASRNAVVRLAISKQGEREKFSQRLKFALTNAQYRCDSSSVLAFEFNKRYEGSPVTSYATRKWLEGVAIPTQEKLCVLAEWLSVPPDWLRFGKVEAVTRTSCDWTIEPSNADTELLRTIKSLNLRERGILDALIRAILESRAPQKSES
jgi:hypothetical protein